MRRVLTSALLGAAVVAGLTGCVRATVDTTVHEDGTFSQHTVLAFDESVAQQAGTQFGVDIEDLAGDIDAAPQLADLESRFPGAVEIADYDDGELEGVEITITDLPLEEFNSAARDAAAGLGAGATLERVDESFEVTLSPPPELDLSQAGVTESNLDLVAGSIDVAVTYTFPGLVESTTAGEIDGHTVTLGLSDLAGGEEIVIVAGASSAIDWEPILTWGGFALGLVLVVGGATALIVQDRRRRSASTLPEPGTTDDPHGPGMLGDDGSAR